MLSPSKHAKPDQTVVAISTLLLKQLLKKRLVDYDALLHHARSSARGGDILFLPAVNFLFLLGLVEYRPKTDSFEYVGRAG